MTLRGSLPCGIRYAKAVYQRPQRTFLPIKYLKLNQNVFGTKFACKIDMSRAQVSILVIVLLIFAGSSDSLADRGEAAGAEVTSTDVDQLGTSTPTHTDSSTPAAENNTGKALARRFARGITRRARAGWNIRDIEVDDHGDGATLSVTMASKKSARRFSLEFGASGREIVGFDKKRVRVPRERRIYPVQAELIRLLETTAPTQMQYECASYFLDGFDAGLSIDPMDYYVVEERHDGWGAAPALASVLADALDGGLELVAVEEAEAGAESTDSEKDHPAIEFSFAGETSKVIHVTLDKQDRVVAVEVRRVPHIYKWQVYTRGGELLSALRSRASIKRVTTTDTGLQNDDTSVILDSRLVIDMDDFEVGDAECPC